VLVFSNEEKGWPGRMLLAHKYPTLEAFVVAASAAVNVRPVAKLYFPDGTPLRVFDQITADTRLVVTKKGGLPFDGQRLPRLIAR
jgi:hypothetical protein